MASALRASRFIVAALVAAAFVLSAPFIGQFRSTLRSSFPRQFVAIVGSILAVMLLVLLAAALRAVRDRRAFRYGAIAGSLVVAAGYARWHATGRPDVDVVELFHFVEYGVVTFLFYRAWRPLGDASVLVLAALAGMLVGTLDEGLQWFIPARVGEINDVLLNSVAIGCGLLFSVGADPGAGMSASLRPGSLTRVGRLLALDILALGAFLQIVHLGYRVNDLDAGQFVSRYTRDELLQLDVAKRAEWSARPLPTKLRRVSREDQYMTEGVVHVQERNEQWAAGHARAAWCENRILEEYFDSVLDAPSYVSLTGHRWSPEQRAVVQAAAAGAPGASYISDAYPYPIYQWPKGLFWAVVVASAVIGVAATTALDRRRGIAGSDQPR